MTHMRRGTAWLGVALMIGSAGCSSSAAAKPLASPSAGVHTFAGGCAGTTLTDGMPPVWAQGGWTQTAAPWPVPWAPASGGDAVAYVFANALVAGASPRVNGTNNKILWVARGYPAGFLVQGHPLGGGAPTMQFPGGPSIVDVPAPGCWTFEVHSGTPDRAGGIFNFQVLPAGSQP